MIKEVNFRGNVKDIAELIMLGKTENAFLYIIRNFIPQETCQQIEKNFYSLIKDCSNDRPNDGYVKNEQIGSSQFAKNGKEYIASTIDASKNVMDVFAGLDNDYIQNIFMDKELENYFLTQNILYRPALHLTNTANFATTRRWLHNGEMSLHPHDDNAQLFFAAQDDFEISKGKNIIACNLCISTDIGSELVIWDLKPDDKIRKELNISKTGYPYPLEYVNNFKKKSIKLNPGDLYFLNASYVHGVTNSKNSDRITSGRFITHINNKVVRWT